MYIGKSYSWLAKKAMRGLDDPGHDGPRFGKHGRSVLYLKEDLDAWLERSFPTSSNQTTQGSANGNDDRQAEAA